MNDYEALADTLQIGGSFAVGAALLYLASSRHEPPGLRFLPSTGKEWAHYWFRCLFLSIIAALIISPSDEFARGLLLLIAFLLLGSSCAFWETDRWFCATGFVLSIAAILWTLLFPAISATRTA